MFRMGLVRTAVAVAAVAGAFGAREVVAADPAYAGKRVLHVDSYHAGNMWNDRIAAAVSETLEGAGVELRIVHMDAKRQPSEEANRAAALRIKGDIEQWRPDVVTASDDNAAQYLIATHYKDADLPFVFCGLNWDASIYGMPYRNVTGMVEVSPIPQIVRLLRQHAKGDRLGYIAEDTTTKRKELEFHRKLFGITYDQVYFAKTFAQWQDGFRRAQQEVDMLLVLGVGAITDWDDAKGRTFAEAESRIPAGTDFSWLMNVSLLGVAKVPEEQGRWAAQAALKILDGVPPSRIPVTHNKEGRLYFNPAIAARLGISDYPPLAELVR